MIEKGDFQLTPLSLIERVVYGFEVSVGKMVET